MTQPHDATLLTVFVNPLLWPEADRRTPKKPGEVPTEGNLLAFLQGPIARADVEEMRRRYDELTAVDRAVLHLPLHPAVAPNILLPIVQSKGAYILGHYVSCIALCGAIAECLAIFRYSVVPEAERSRLGLSNAQFEEKSQGEREKRLRSWGLIDDAVRDHFKMVRDLRRPYLHLLTTDKSNAKRDALRSYGATIQLLLRVLGIGVSGGAFTLHPDVLRAMRDLPQA